MAIIHVDLVSGNDANDGSTWLLAKKTIPINASNEVRVAKSPDPVSSGVNGTFVKYTNTIILESALSKTIDQAVGNTWVSSANVTGGTYTTYRKLGASCQQFAIAAGFTTGKVAYKAISLSDFSSYSKISFWLSVNSVLNAVNSNLRLCLCSDTQGNVIINSIPLTILNVQANYLYSILQDYGGPLGNNIQSVALYADADGGALTIRLNNIEAVNNVHHQSLIGISNINGSRWYGIESIVDTTITIAHGYSITSGGSLRGYDEDSGMYLLYYRLPIIYTTQNNISGVALTIELLFGWNKVSNEMDGETWLDYLLQYNIYAFNISISGTGGSTRFKNVGIYRSGIAFQNSAIATSVILENVSIVCCIPLNNSILTAYSLAVDGLIVSNCTGYADNNGIQIRGGSKSIKNVQVLNCIMTSTTFYGILFVESLATKFENIRVSNNTTGILINGHGNYFLNTIIQHIYTLDLTINGGETIFDNFELIDRGTGALYMGANTLIKNSPDLSSYNFGTGYGHTWLKLREINRLLGINRVWIDAKVYVFWQTVVKRDGEDGAWQFGNTTYSYTGNDDIRPGITLPEIAVLQDVEITVSVWLFTGTATGNKLVVRPEICDVIDGRVEVDIPATGIGTWQLIPITLTPVKTGILVLEIIYVTGNVYVGSIVL